MSDNFFGKLFGGEAPPGDDNKPKAPAAPPSAPAPARPPAPPPGAGGPPLRPVMPGGPSAPTQPAGAPARPPMPPAGQPMPPRPAGPAAPNQAPPPPRPTGIPSGISQSAMQRPGPAPSKKDEDDGEVIIDDLLRLIVDKSGSDLHLTVGSPPMLRLQDRKSVV